MAALSSEEENYVRMAILMTGVSPRAVRALFDREFAPVCLKMTLSKEGNKLFDLKSRRVINQVQWNLLFPSSGNVESKTFDVSLMICLIRHLTNLVHPSNGFEGLPPSREVTPCADLARLKYYRNHIAHSNDNKMDNSSFSEAWNEISGAISRLGGPTMLQECTDLKNKILDQSNQEMMLEIKCALVGINDMKLSIESLESSYSDLQTKHIEMAKEMEKMKEYQKDTVPWNVRDTYGKISKMAIYVKLLNTVETKQQYQLDGSQKDNAVYASRKLKIIGKFNIGEIPSSLPIRSGHVQKTIETWRKNDEMFVDTQAAKHVLKCIKASNCVTVTASSGVGKTATVRHVALQMAEDGYDIIPVTDPCDISKFHNPTQKTLFVVDDLCGKYSLNQTDTDKWRSQIQFIEPLLEVNTTKIIASCRLQVYQDEQFETISLFKSCECNLLSKNLCLLEAEKTAIATKYLGKKSIEVLEFYHLYDFFPLLCKLYKENPKVSISQFFRKPYSIYEGELDKLCKEGAGKYCALALCVMFNNHLPEEWLTEECDKDIRTVIKNTCEACKLSRRTPRLVFKDELDSMLCTFIRKEGNIYSSIHDKVFDFMAYYFGKVMIKRLIKNANASFISKRFLFQHIEGSDPFVIIVPTEYQLMYICRMVDDLFKNNVTDVFGNINMYDASFRQEFLCHLQTLSVPDQSTLAHKTDKDGLKNTILIAACFYGDMKMLKWCCRNKVNVNQCRQDGTSPLFMACQKGYTEIVNILLTNKADINKCENMEVSPLYVACQNGHTEIVNILVNNKADINKCRDVGLSPLYIACLSGHTEIVNILVNNKADINKCDFEEISPLYRACLKGHIEIVNFLVNNKADINKCDYKKVSPLLIACHNGNTEIVNVLLNNKADINKCCDNEISPLYIACENGHVEIVNILINNKADINKCQDMGVSALHIACSNGHTEIVKILIKNKAVINKCTDKGTTPLYAACREGQTEIVNLLLDNKADIHKCDIKGASPLSMACARGHTEIVNILLNNSADINMCDNVEVSPLFMACQNGHTEVVNILLHNKADINKCNSEEMSALYIACQNGHSEIVNILLNNKADINKCDKNEISPLNVACLHSHSEIVNILLKSKADINKCMDMGASPLYIACLKSQTEIVNILLNNKADINKCDKNEISPLNIACHNGNTEIVNSLLYNKADINKCKDTGASPLYIACLKGHTEVVNILLNNKADINKCNNAEVSPLIVACHKGHTEIVNILVNNKADINKCDIMKVSPLFIACQEGHTEIVNILLNNKADINMCTQFGISPRIVALLKGHTSIFFALYAKQKYA